MSAIRVIRPAMTFSRSSPVSGSCMQWSAFELRLRIPLIGELAIRIMRRSPLPGLGINSQPNIKPQ